MLWFHLDFFKLKEGVMNELTGQQITTIKDAAQKLTGLKRRAFQAQVALDYLDGNPRRAALCANVGETPTLW